MVTNIIQFTKFSGNECAKQMADLNISRCDSVIYCKTQAEAFCYKVIIEHFSKSSKGVDHLQGTIAICVDSSSTMIEGMHLITQRSIPNSIKQSYPFLLQAKIIGKENQAKYLESCGLTTEKELKAVWAKCANRLRFPVEATYEEKSTYTDMFSTASSIISDAEYNKRKVYLDELKQVEDAIANWFTMRFGKNFQGQFYTWKKTWKYVYSIEGCRSIAFVVDIEYSQSRGIESFRISYPGLNLDFSFSWKQDKNIDAVIKRIEMMWKQFLTIMEAISKSYKATTMNITV